VILDVHVNVIDHVIVAVNVDVDVDVSRSIRSISLESRGFVI
jgi:hypothetical protein